MSPACTNWSGRGLSCSAPMMNAAYTVSAARTCQQEEPLHGEIEQEARSEREAGVRLGYVRRLCARWGDYLRAFHALSGSREWRTSLAKDLRLLASAARVARGTALDTIPPQYLGEGDAANDSLRCAKSKLFAHINSGRVLATDADSCETVEAALEAGKASKASKAGKGPREAAEWFALSVVGSAM